MSLNKMTSQVPSSATFGSPQRLAVSGANAGTRGVESGQRQGANASSALLKHLAMTTNKPPKPPTRASEYPKV